MRGRAVSLAVNAWNHRLRPSAMLAGTLALASPTAGRSPSEGDCAIPDAGSDAALLLSMGDDRDGSFWLLAPGDEASLVLGPQGGWMVLVTVELPAEWRDTECVQLTVDGAIGSLEVEPIAVRFEPARHLTDDRDVVRYGPIPLFLDDDVELLYGRMLDLRARAFSARGRAEAALRVALRRP